MLLTEESPPDLIDLAFTCLERVEPLRHYNVVGLSCGICPLLQGCAPQPGRPAGPVGRSDLSPAPHELTRHPREAVISHQPVSQLFATFYRNFYRT
jgi:hypothetical protein